MAPYRQTIVLIIDMERLMTTSPPSTSQATPGRNAVVITALVAGSVLLLLSLMSALPAIAAHFTGNWNGEAGFVTPDVPFTETGLATKDGGPSYSGVAISSAEPLVAPRMLAAAATALGSLTAIGGCLLVVVLAARLLARRSFTRLARWGLVVLGVLVMITAAVAPQLDALSVDLAVQELGYPILADGGAPVTAGSPDQITLNLWGVWAMSRVDFTLLLLGGILALLGFLVSDGMRLQRDSDGLV
jgi:hypothetical protein